MAEQNLDIVVSIRGGQVVSQQVAAMGAEIKGAGAATAQTTSRTQQLRSALGGIAAGVLVYKGFSALKGAINDTAQLAKETMTLQRFTSLDTQTAAGWVELAKERGIQSKQLNQGFIGMSKQIVSAANGSKTAARAFDTLGLSASKMRTMDTQKQMGLLADAFSKLPPGANKAAIAQTIFGRNAQAMLPFLSQGSKAINEQVTALGKATGMTSQSQAASMKLVQAQREWQASTTALKGAVALALLPVLQSLITIFMPLVQAFASAMQSSTAFRVVIVALAGGFAVYVLATQAARLANIAFMASAAPWLAIGTALVLLFVTLYQKCSWFRTAVSAVGSAAVAAFNWMKQAGIDAFNWVKGNWPLLVSILGGPLGAAAVQVIKHWNDIKGAGVSAFNAVRGAVSAVGNVIGGAVTGAVNGLKAAFDSVLGVINSVVKAGNSIANFPNKVLSAINPFGQHGLYMSSGGMAVVGEKGPEMVSLPQGSQVHPFMTMSGGGGGGRVVVPVYLDRRQIALAMGDYTAGEQAAR
jgi:hypothetical protein